MPVRRWTDPNVDPRRRNRQPLDAQETLFVPDRFTLDIKIFKIVVLYPAIVTGRAVADVAQRGFFRRRHRISHNLKRGDSISLFTRIFRSGVHIIQFAAAIPEGWAPSRSKLRGDAGIARSRAVAL